MTNTVTSANGSHNGSKPRRKRAGKKSAIGEHKHKRTGIDVALGLLTPIVGQEFLDKYGLRDHRGGGRSSDLVARISLQMRVEWSQALIVILLFLFGYLFFLSKEVKFARRIDHYELLVERLPWESVWPFFLIVVLLLIGLLIVVAAGSPAGAFLYSFFCLLFEPENSRAAFAYVSFPLQILYRPTRSFLP